MDKEGRVEMIVGIDRNITEWKRYEEQATEQAEILKQVFDHLPQCIFVKDENLVYVKCNQRFAERHGYNEPGDVVGKRDTDFWEPEEAARYTDIDKKVMARDRGKLDFREKQQFPGKSPRVLETSKIPLHDVYGNVIGVLGIYEDITERL